MDGNNLWPPILTTIAGKPASGCATVLSDDPSVYSQPAYLTRVVTDTDKARDIRAKMMPLLDELLIIMNDAKNAGLIISFNIGQDQWGRVKLTDINIVRPL